MKAAASILGLVIVLAIGWFIIKSQVTHGPEGGAPPQEVIDIAGVKSDLLAIGQAERLCLASHGAYASLDQLQQDGALSFSGADRRGYHYTADIDDGQHFKITATPSDPAKTSWPTLSIDDTMQISQP